MDMLGVMMIDVGLVCVFVGAICMCKPIAMIGIKSRVRALTLALSGVLAIVVGGSLPVRDTRVPEARTQLDLLTPVYQFHERHYIDVNAPCERVYEATKAVEPDEIFGFRTLTWIRRFGRRGGDNILNPRAHQPIFQTALRTGFVSLVDQPNQEIVIGLMMSSIRMGWRPTPEEFKKAGGPLTAKATMNFRMEPRQGNRCTLSTETRIYGSDKEALKLVAMYWRVIYPGSAFIRRMWLRAICKRAESPGNLIGA